MSAAKEAQAAKEDFAERYVPCYNCDKGKVRFGMCGMPSFDFCPVCKQFGMPGLLPREQADKDFLIDNVQYVSPRYQCHQCKDTKKREQCVWIPSLVDRRCSDNGAHNMPREMLSCSDCCAEAHEAEVADIRARYK